LIFLLSLIAPVMLGGSPLTPVGSPGGGWVGTRARLTPAAGMRSEGYYAFKTADFVL
jgi:hypothetical protein